LHVGEAVMACDQTIVAGIEIRKQELSPSIRNSHNRRRLRLLPLLGTRGRLRGNVHPKRDSGLAHG
jgi:hypothetical protein